MTAEAIAAWSAPVVAITGVLWPIIAVGLVFAFREPAARTLKRFSERGGSLEVSGLKIEVATEQQQLLIEDLQKQVTELRRAVGLDKDQPTPSDWVGSAPAAHVPATYDNRTIASLPAGGGRTSVIANRAVNRSAHPRLLSVDDHPENNALI